jgi:hypothetical protein
MQVNAVQQALGDKSNRIGQQRLVMQTPKEEA